MSTTLISRSEEDLRTATAFLKKENPALGIAKRHAILLSDNPSWTLSEKRLRRFLKNSDAQQHGFESTAAAPAGGSGPLTVSETHLCPPSTLIEGLDAII